MKPLRWSLGTALLGMIGASVQVTLLARLWSLLCHDTATPVVFMAKIVLALIGITAMATAVLASCGPREGAMEPARQVVGALLVVIAPQVLIGLDLGFLPTLLLWWIATAAVLRAALKWPSGRSIGFAPIVGILLTGMAVVCLLAEYLASHVR